MQWIYINIKENIETIFPQSKYLFRNFTIAIFLLQIGSHEIFFYLYYNDKIYFHKFNIDKS